MTAAPGPPGDRRGCGQHSSLGRAEHVRQQLRHRTMLVGLRLKLAPDAAGGMLQHGRVKGFLRSARPGGSSLLMVAGRLAKPGARGHAAHGFTRMPRPSSSPWIRL